MLKVPYFCDRIFILQQEAFRIRLLGSVIAKGGTTRAHTGSQDIFGDNIVVFPACHALIMVSVCRQMTWCGLLWMGLFLLGKVWTNDFCLWDGL